MNTATLKRLQRGVTRLLPDSAAVTTFTPGGSDGAGGELESTPTTVSVPVDVAPLGNTPQEQAIAAQFTALTLWRLTFPAGTVLDAAAIVTANGHTYQVRAVLDGESDPLFVQAIATRGD